MLVCGVALIAGSWGHFRAHLAAGVGDSAAQLLQRGELPTDEGFRRLLASREAASRSAPMPAFDRDRGLALIALAQQAGDDQARRRMYLARARDAFATATGKVPTQPMSLAMLAYVDSELGEATEAARILRLGWQLAPYSPEYAILRTWVAIVVWNELSDLDHDRAGRDFRAAMTRDPDRFLKTVVNTGFEGPARQALQADPLLSDRFEAALGAQYQ
jgi:hypothetical protein